MKQLDEIIALLHSTISQVSPYSTDVIGQSSKDFQERFLVDLGVNSIDYAEIATLMMDNLHVDLPLNTFYKVNKVRDIAEILHSSQAA